MAGEVERSNGEVDQGAHPVEQFGGRPGQREHTSVVVGIAMDVEQEIAARAGEKVDHGDVSSLTHVHRRREHACAHDIDAKCAARRAGSAGRGDANGPTRPE